MPAPRPTMPEPQAPKEYADPRCREARAARWWSAIKGFEQDIEAAIARVDAIPFEFQPEPWDIESAVSFRIARRDFESAQRRANKSHFTLRAGQKELARFSHGNGKRQFVVIGPESAPVWTDRTQPYKIEHARIIATPRRGDREYAQAIILGAGDQTLWLVMDRMSRSTGVLFSAATGNFAERLIVASKEFWPQMPALPTLATPETDS